MVVFHSYVNVYQRVIWTLWRIHGTDLGFLAADVRFFTGDDAINETIPIICLPYSSGRVHPLIFLLINYLDSYGIYDNLRKIDASIVVSPGKCSFRLLEITIKPILHLNLSQLGCASHIGSIVF